MIKCEIIALSCFGKKDRKGTKLYGYKFFNIEDENIPIKIVENLFCEKLHAVIGMELINKHGISEVHIDDVLHDIIISVSDMVCATSLLA